MLPTKDDMNIHLRTFSQPRFKLVTYNYWLLNEPHIVKHIAVRIYYNPYVDGTRLRNPLDNIYVELIAKPTFCKKITCQAYLPNAQTCTATHKPQAFKSGNTDIPACQCGCFAAARFTRPFRKPAPLAEVVQDMKAKPTDPIVPAKKPTPINTSDSYYRMPFVEYNANNQCCILYDNSMFRLAIDPISRSNESVPRLTTIGTGDDLSPAPFRDENGNETFHFKLNKYRCDDAQLQFKNGECEPSIGETIGGFFIGGNVYKLFQFGGRYITRGIGFKENNRPTLPPVDPSSIPEQYEQWIDDIDPHVLPIDPFVRLSDLGIGHFGMRRFIWTTEYGEPRLIAPNIMYREISTPYDMATEKSIINPKSRKLKITERNFIAETAKAASHLKRKANGHRMYSEELLDNLNFFETRLLTNTPDEPDEHWSVKDIMLMILQTLANVAEIELQIAGVQKVREILAYVASEMGQRMMKQSLAVGSERLISKFSVNSVSKLIFHAGVGNTFKTAVRAAAMLASTLSTVLFVADILLVFDFILSFFNLFNLERVGNQDSLDAYSKLDIDTKLKLHGFGTHMITPSSVLTTLMQAKTDRIAAEAVGSFKANAKNSVENIPNFDPVHLMTLVDLMHTTTSLERANKDTVDLLKKYYPKEMFLPDKLPGGAPIQTDAIDLSYYYRPKSSNGINISFCDVVEPNKLSVQLDLMEMYYRNLVVNSDGKPIDLSKDVPYIQTVNGRDLPPVTFEDMEQYSTASFIEENADRIFSFKNYDDRYDPLHSDPMVKRVKMLTALLLGVTLLVPVAFWIIKSGLLIYLIVIVAFLAVHTLFQVSFGHMLVNDELERTKLFNSLFTNIN